MYEMNLLTLVACTFIVVYALVFVHFKISRRLKFERQAWEFYAVRDRFIALVRDGKLDTNSTIYLHFYPHSNDIINNIHNLTFGGILMSLKSVNAETIEKTQLLQQEVNNSTPEVKSVVHDFFRAIVYTLVDNSLLLKILVLLKDLLPESKHKRPRQAILVDKHDLVRTWREARGLEAKFA